MNYPKNGPCPPHSYWLGMAWPLRLCICVCRRNNHPLLTTDFAFIIYVAILPPPSLVFSEIIGFQYSLCSSDGEGRPGDAESRVPKPWVSLLEPARYSKVRVIVRTGRSGLCRTLHTWLQLCPCRRDRLTFILKSEARGKVNAHLESQYSGG